MKTSRITNPRPLFLREFQSSTGEVPSLDGMRAISVLAVMMSHMGFAWVPGGHGVFLFFIISGFLITRLLFVEQNVAGQINVRNFYIRRFFRLYPVILAYCLIVVPVFFLQDGYINFIEPISALFYFANYLVVARDLVGLDYQMPFKIFWSLSVEEHFYIIFPLMVLKLRTPLKVFYLATSVCFVTLMFRLATAYSFPELVNTHYLYMRSEYRIDAVAFGVALASVCDLPRAKSFLTELIRPGVFVAALAVAISSIAVGGDWFANVLRYSILGPCITMLIAAILFSDRYRYFQIILNLRPMLLVGRLSYSLYVWHIPCMLVATYMFAGPSGMILAWPLSFAVAALSYYYIEKPAMRFGAKFGGQKRQTLS